MGRKGSKTEKNTRSEDFIRPNTAPSRRAPPENNVTILYVDATCMYNTKEKE